MSQRGGREASESSSVNCVVGVVVKTSRFNVQSAAGLRPPAASTCLHKIKLQTRHCWMNSRHNNNFITNAGFKFKRDVAWKNIKLSVPESKYVAVWSDKWVKNFDILLFLQGTLKSTNMLWTRSDLEGALTSQTQLNVDLYVWLPYLEAHTCASIYLFKFIVFKQELQK